MPHPIDCNEIAKAQENDWKLISLINNPQRLEIEKTNEKIEKWHRSLEIALKAYNTKHWSDALPVILLSFRTAYKEDVQSSTAELLYGTTIHLPEEFFDSSPMDLSPIQLVEYLKRHFDSIRPSSASSHSMRSVFVHPALQDCSHVFIRNDTVGKHLQTHHDGPFKVLHRTDKTFDVGINGRKSTLYIDRVKPDFLESDSASELIRDILSPSK
ncbi:pol polyprotein [Trichonephila clavipes]|nr:pol polyprotein [Trichonephila clavipes]